MFNAQGVCERVCVVCCVRESVCVVCCVREGGGDKECAWWWW